MFAATGELVSEKCWRFEFQFGRDDAHAAFFAALASWLTGVAIVGLLVGVVAAVLLGVVQGTPSVYLRANQLVVWHWLQHSCARATDATLSADLRRAVADLIPGLADLELRPLAAISVLGPALFQQSPLLWVELFFGGLVVVVAPPYGTGSGCSRLANPSHRRPGRHFCSRDTASWAFSLRAACGFGVLLPSPTFIPLQRI